MGKRWIVGHLLAGALQQVGEMVLEEVEDGDSISEAILVTAKEGKGRSVSINIERYPHPSQA